MAARLLPAPRPAGRRTDALLKAAVCDTSDSEAGFLVRPALRKTFMRPPSLAIRRKLASLLIVFFSL
jgi:hypothetical protein